MENPISIGLDALKLKESNVPLEQITAGIFDKLQTLDNRLGVIQNQLIRQAIDNLFNPINELFPHKEPNEIGKNLARNIISTFKHEYT